ncbi:hypothetical protein [Tardiphaga alba]|nr:hypothetical protein [Tardiphaga alba]
MPVDSMIVSAAVLAMFLCFAAALGWATIQAPGRPSGSAVRNDG